MANANRSTHPINTPKSEAVLLTAKLTGGGAAGDMVNAESANQGGGEVSACVYNSATGKFAVTFRHTYPSLLCAPVVTVVGTTDGLHGMFSAIDITAGTAVLELYVGNTATDPATTDTIYFMWVVRNSGRNA